MGAAVQGTPEQIFTGLFSDIDDGHCSHVVRRHFLVSKVGDIEAFTRFGEREVLSDVPHFDRFRWDNGKIQLYFVQVDRLDGTCSGRAILLQYVCPVSTWGYS